MSRLTCLTFDFPPGVGGVQRYLYEILRRIARHHPVTVITPVPAPALNPIVAWSFLAHAGTSGCVRWSLPTPTGCSWDTPTHGCCSWRCLSLRIVTRPWLTATTIAPHSVDGIAPCSIGFWHTPIRSSPSPEPMPVITKSGLAFAHRHLSGHGSGPLYAARRSPLFPPVLLTVGRLVPRKGVDTVLRALPLLRTSFPDLRYRVVGSGPYLERLMKLSHQLDVQGMVEFVGRVPESGLPGVYQNAHIFVMPVREEQGGASVEGFGIVFLEAAASGLPVVTTWGSGAEEALVPGETGRLVPPDDPAALAAVLLDLLRDAHLREAMGQAGRRWVETHMTWEHAAERMEEALSGE
jgi:Glycosyltransferase